MDDVTFHFQCMKVCCDMWYSLKLQYFMVRGVRDKLRQMYVDEELPRSLDMRQNFRIDSTYVCLKRFQCSTLLLNRSLI